MVYMNNYYKLTITRIINNVLFMKSIRHMPNMSLIEVNNIKNELPYIVEGLFLRPQQIENYFKDNCEYTYQEYVEYKESHEHAPWERKEYIDAKNWYLTLPKEDRDKIDILVKSNMLWA